MFFPFSSVPRIFVGWVHEPLGTTSDLILHHEANENSQKRFKPLPDIIDGKKEFEVEKVVGRQVIQGIVNYQLRFKGYSTAGNYDFFSSGDP
jgi:hypothetical protein